MRRLLLRLSLLLGASTFVLGAEDVKKLSPDELKEALATGKYTMLDVRERNELEEFGTVKGYLHIPLGQLDKRLAEVPKGKPVVTL
jgi:rhodanese-related sulfurtransferase